MLTNSQQAHRCWRGSCCTNGQYSQPAWSCLAARLKLPARFKRRSRQRRNIITQASRASDRLSSSKRAASLNVGWRGASHLAGDCVAAAAGGVPVVLDGVLAAARDALCNLGPAVASLLMRSDQQLLLLHSPSVPPDPLPPQPSAIQAQLHAWCKSPFNDDVYDVEWEKEGGEERDGEMQCTRAHANLQMPLEMLVQQWRWVKEEVHTGRSWLFHRSRHCLPIRPGKC